MPDDSGAALILSATARGNLPGMSQSEITGKQLAIILPLVVIAALVYGYCDYTQDHSRPRSTATAPVPAPIRHVPTPLTPPSLDSLVTWRAEYDAPTQELGRKVLQVIDDVCQIDALRAHIESVRIDVDNDASYLWVHREYGWQPVVTVQLRMRDDQAAWNALGPDPRGAAGHTFHLMAGGGRRPGLVAGKQWIRDRCRMDVGYGGENGIRDVHAFAFIGATKAKKRRR